MSEKTEAPTEKRLRDAREKGDVPRAPMAATFSVYCFAVVLSPLFRAHFMRIVATLRHLVEVHSLDAWPLFMQLAADVTPVAILLIAATAIPSVMYGGLVFSPGRLKLDFSRFNPVSGLGRLADKTRWVNALRGALVFVLAIAMVWRMILLAPIARVDPLAISAQIAQSIAITLAMIGVPFAIFDVLIARRIWHDKLKMSKEETKREFKDNEPNPEIRQRREELHHEMLAREAVNAVKDASVIVVNPTHLACTLKYQPDVGDEESAPILTAKGAGIIAAKMIEAAKIYGVPIIRDVPVAHALYELDTGTEIPEVLYEAVAEIIRMAWEGRSD